MILIGGIASSTAMQKDLSQAVASPSLCKLVGFKQGTWKRTEGEYEFCFSVELRYVD
jgi:hypothetical protein